MSSKLYALLVGIDEYAAPVSGLRGCANDIRAFESVLRGDAGRREKELRLKVLLDKDATREAVIAGFLGHLAGAGEGDVALFYYSGHGSQERTPPEYWAMEPDGLDETLVLFDSREPGKYDLADKELSRLIREVARRGAHVVVILDCCHAGSGTRAFGAGGQGLVRHVPMAEGVRAASTFLVVPGAAEGAEQAAGRHVLFAACRDDEEARETAAGAERRGVFSYYLAETLGNAMAGATYRDVFSQTSARVRGAAGRQTPVVEAVESEDLDRPFLGGAIAAHRAYYTAHYREGRGWVLDAGTVQGVPAPVGEESAWFAIFPMSETLDPGEALRGQIGEGRVTRTTAATADLELTLSSGAADTAATYKAVLVALPMPPMGVRFRGDAAMLGLVREALGRCGAGGGASLLAAEVGEDAKVELVAGAAGFRLTRAGEADALAVDVADTGPAGASKVVERLEHIAAWMRVMELRNPSARLPAGSLELKVFRVGEDGREEVFDPAMPVTYTLREGVWKPGRMRIRMRNRSQRRLYCTLVDLPETFGIFTGLLPANGVWLKPGEEQPAIVEGNEIFDVNIPKELLEQGLMQLRDTLKLIGSTEEWDATLLDQPDLDGVVVRGERRAITPLRNTLARLMSRVQTRHFAPTATTDDLADWTTAEVTVTIVRPREHVGVPEAGGEEELAPGLRLLGHATFSAQVRLTPEGIASREAGLAAEAAEPAWLRDTERFAFGGTRSDTPPLSVLELRAMGGRETVTAEAPLRLRSDVVLREGETILPYAFDGEFYVPLGVGLGIDGGTEIRLVRLPSPDTKSLLGSVKIFFKKLVLQPLGVAFEYPLLAAVEPVGGKVVYVTGREAVAEKVRGAGRILLYIHGIIGDTRGMTASAFEGVGSGYDLVLGFDYENLNTPIEETARDLNERLAGVGLGAGHGKVLHVAAHSMGGLVARWFIEVEGGKEVVQHLTMLGTPNGGSPWPHYEAWLTTLLGIGLNGLAEVQWPSTVLGSVMHGLVLAGKAAAGQGAKVEVALRQLDPGSPFLRALAGAADPGVGYTIVAGNTSLIGAAVGGETSRLGRLLARLSPADVLHRTTALAFFRLPNDIAVSVEAIEGIPGGRVQPAVVREVACDHVTYFSNAEALGFIRGAGSLTRV